MNKLINFFNVSFDRKMSIYSFSLMGWTFEMKKKLERSYKNRFIYQKKFTKFKIKKSDTVVDLGCGVDPFPLANVLVDKYLKPTTHRARGTKVVKDNRPLLSCDIGHLPFKDKSIDFSYCSHVLEHTENPAIACEEIMRTSKRGYIETPTKMSDILFNFTWMKNHHIWHVTQVKNTLIFVEWQKKERRDTKFSFLFKLAHAKHNNYFKSFFDKNRDYFSNMFLWKDKFEYIVIDKNGQIIATNSKLKKN